MDVLCLQKNLEQSTREVCKVQNEFLMKQLRDNKATEWGDRYLFYDVENYCDYKEYQPLTRYCDYANYIERMMCGECNLLTRENPVLFAITANTTPRALRKVIPVTQTQK